MSIISKNKIIPSERLIEKYKDSEEAKKLNLPEFEYLNVEIGITKEKYDYIKKVNSFNYWIWIKIIINKLIKK